MNGVVLALLISGAGLAVLTSRIISMPGSLEKSANDRRKIQAEQINASAVAVLKQLFSPGVSGLPAVFPEPYLRTDTATPVQFASALTSKQSQSGVWGLDATNGTWGVDLSPSASELTSASTFQRLQIRPTDPTKTDFATFFSGNLSAAVSVARVQVKAVAFATASGNGLGPVNSAEFALAVPVPGRADKSANLKVRIAVPPPPPPSCTLDIVPPALSGQPTQVRLLASGVATSATIKRQSPAADLAALGPGAASPATSVYGKNVQMLSTMTSEPVGNLSGTVSGPGGAMRCGSVAP